MNTIYTTNKETLNSPINSVTSISWGAITAGSVVTIVVASLLNLLGIGLGFVLFTPDSDVINGIGIGSIIWLIFSAIVSMFAGGWVTGKMSGFIQPTIGALHGLLTWSVATIFTFILVASTAGVLISGTYTVIEKSLSIAGKGISNIASLAPQANKTLTNLAPNLTPAVDTILNEADEVIQKAVKNSSDEQSKEKLNQAIRDLFEATNNEDIAEARHQAATILAQITEMNPQEAEQTIGEWQQSYNDMKEDIMQKAQEASQQVLSATEKAVNLAGRLALISFFVLVIGAGMAMLGGSVGVKQ